MTEERPKYSEKCKRCGKNLQSWAHESCFVCHKTTDLAGLARRENLVIEKDEPCTKCGGTGDGRIERSLRKYGDEVTLLCRRCWGSKIEPKGKRNV